jgi:DNA-binding NarL/FixJ family response regulator
VRVLLADDQPLLRAVYKGVIDSAPDLEVVGEAVTGSRPSSWPGRPAPTSCSWTSACRTWTA